jgi:hypothetical protein
VIRAGRFQISGELLRSVLRLPDDTRFGGVIYNAYFDVFEFVAAQEDMPEVPDGALLPLLQPTVAVRNASPEIDPAKRELIFCGWGG